MSNLINNQEYLQILERQNIVQKIESIRHKYGITPQHRIKKPNEQKNK